MDSVEATKQYMTEYNKLIAKHESKDIVKMVDSINAAIADSNVPKINELYQQLAVWNDHVSNLQGARIVLNKQYKHVKLPSVAEFLVVFDNFSKEWRFNTEAD